MYQRIFDIEHKLNEAMFLFGARQTGKSTFLKERFRESITLSPVVVNVQNIRRVDG